MLKVNSSRGDLTRSAVLAVLGGSGPLSRTDIAKRLSVSPATITAVTKELLLLGVIHEVEQQASRGGRPGQLLALSGAAGRAIGVKVAADHVACVEARLDGSLVDTWRGPFDPLVPNAPDLLVELVKNLVDVRRDGEGPLLGVGIAVPGAVDQQGGGIVDAPTLGWQRMTLGDRLRHEVGLPVLLENDVSAVAVAERLYGRGRDHRDFVVVTIGTGVGAGLVVDQKLFRGAGGGAGEFGHVPVTADGPVCACGNHGCLEAHVGEPAILRDARAARVIGPDGSIDDLLAAADRGDEPARAIYAEAGATLGRAVAGLVNVLDPELVVVLGEGTVGWHHWRPGFEPTLRAHLLPARRGIAVDVESWDDYSWALGAAALVLAVPYDTEGTAGEEGALVRARLRGEGLVSP